MSTSDFISDEETWLFLAPLVRFPEDAARLYRSRCLIWLFCSASHLCLLDWSVPGGQSEHLANEGPGRRRHAVVGGFS